jgi:hypothetical protein
MVSACGKVTDCPRAGWHMQFMWSIEPNFLSGPVTLAGRKQVIVMP